MNGDNLTGKWRMRNGKICTIRGESQLIKAVDEQTIWQGTIDKYTCHWLGYDSISHKDFDLMKRQRGEEQI